MNTATPFRSLALCMLALSYPAMAEDSTNKSEAKVEAKTDATQEFTIPVPAGMPVRGIKIPHRDEKGNLVMVLEADVAKRLDEQNVEMENLKIDAFDEDGKKILIEIPYSIFNLETRILNGDTHALIRREDFEITGDGLTFNTRTRQGTVRGNVKMTILTPDTP